MSKTAKEKRVKAVPVWMGILVFLLAFGAGMVSKTVIRPAYSAQWSDALGTLKTDLPYGEGAANKFDLYLPKDGGKDSYGLDQSDEACGSLFGVMAGVEITAAEVADGSYLEKMKPIASAEWVSHNPVPTVAAYGTHDRVQPFLASLRLKAALEENHVDHVYLEFPHSGHALQNDGALSRQWMEAIEEYPDKYMPVK